jgi:hypothetical protein
MLTWASIFPTIQLQQKISDYYTKLSKITKIAPSSSKVFNQTTTASVALAKKIEISSHNKIHNTDRHITIHHTQTSVYLCTNMKSKKDSTPTSINSTKNSSTTKKNITKITSIYTPLPHSFTKNLGNIDITSSSKENNSKILLISSTANVS